MPELGVGDLACALGVCLSNHPEDLLLGSLLAHHLEDDTQLIGVNLATRVLVERTERLVALGVLLLRESLEFVVVFHVSVKAQQICLHFAVVSQQSICLFLYF